MASTCVTTWLQNLWKKEKSIRITIELKFGNGSSTFLVAKSEEIGEDMGRDALVVLAHLDSLGRVQNLSFSSNQMLYSPPNTGVVCKLSNNCCKNILPVFGQMICSTYE